MADLESRLLGNLQSTMQQMADPFGMLEACWRVQKAWMTHPQALTEQLRELHAGIAMLQVQVQRRMAGLDGEDVIPPVPYDERFQEPVWRDNPCFDNLKEVYLLYTRWLEDAIYASPGVSCHEREKAGFLTRQVLNALAPSNFFWTNPAAMLRFLQTGGMSLVDGAVNYLKDLRRGTIRMADDTEFEVGRNLATTPGAIVYRNELFELIQYAPATETVHEVPIVLVSPWINKYYVLDLDEKKSLIRYLVAQGFTVFVTSWKNPTREMRDTTLDDYMLKGVLQALDVARSIANSHLVHLAGYCIGGTIVAALMAWLNNGGEEDGDQPVSAWSLFTTLVDFEHPGEIAVFIDERTIENLESRMASQGYLDGQDMAGSFRALRSNPLVWHYFINNYLLGEDPPKLDVLFWNMDTTRMPEAMHSFYLREFYLHNRLIERDGVELGGRGIDLRRIRQPLYAVGAEQDHIAPWQETFKIGALVSGPVRYVLATSGHIFGVINPPVQPPKRRYWAADLDSGIDALTWRDATSKVPGSWWEDWITWLRPKCGAMAAPPQLGSEAYPVLGDAPGSYVLER
ncbi:MAG: alpha/beta hydrolase [Proteobacteria bacterium]|nr:MAG: alpha/beta hydrolase [Pseudomonadota bacterium]